MNNLEITTILEISVIGLAVAQALTILLTIRRERDIKELRELVDEQRLHILELRARLAGRNAARPSRAPEPAKMPRDLLEPKTIQPRTTEDEAARAVKVPNLPREIAATLQPTVPPSTAEDELKRATKAINWLKEEVETKQRTKSSKRADDPSPV
jgi:hypothetical protein